MKQMKYLKALFTAAAAAALAFSSAVPAAADAVSAETSADSAGLTGSETSAAGETVGEENESIAGDSGSTLSDEIGTENSPLLNGAVTAADGVSFRLESTLDYTAGTYIQDYIFENTSDTAAEVTVDIPVETTLAEYGISGDEELFTFSSDTDIESHRFLTPLLSGLNIKADEVTAEQLRELDGYEPETEDQDGTVYTLEADSFGSSTLTLTPDSGSTLQIYPIGAAYTAETLDDGTVAYTVSMTEGFDTALVFVPDSQSYSITSDTDEENYPSSEQKMSSFLTDCCSIFLERESYPVLTADDLAPYLITAVSGSTVASDPYSSLEWIVNQDILSVYSASVSVPAGGTATIEAEESGTISGITVYINPNALENGQHPTEDILTVVIPEGYTRAQLHGALGNFNEDTSSFKVSRTSNGVYTVTLGNTPFWQRSSKYLIPMIIVMAVFLIFCFFSYSSQKKKREANAAKQAAGEAAAQKKAQEAGGSKPSGKAASGNSSAAGSHTNSSGAESAREKFTGHPSSAETQGQKEENGKAESDAAKEKPRQSRESGADTAETPSGANSSRSGRKSAQTPPKTRRSLAERANIGDLGGDDQIIPESKDQPDSSGKK
ncbi:MAG: hypothetical protein ACOX8B_09650 [Lachnospiraceae bacterium]|jgi:hypothetical protein